MICGIGRENRRLVPLPTHKSVGVDEDSRNVNPVLLSKAVILNYGVEVVSFEGMGLSQSGWNRMKTRRRCMRERGKCKAYP